MNRLPNQCPICSGEMVITRARCRACDTTLEGRFAYPTLLNLSEEQLRFVELFLKCEGKLNRMEKELNLSYPTVRNRLREIIRALGYEPEEEEEPAAPPEDARRVLDDLEAGRISPEEALRRLEEGGH